MAEKLELVEDFGSLRAGMIVVVKGCRACGRDCRSMLVRLVRGGRYLFLDGDDASGDCWAVTPDCTPPVPGTLGGGLPEMTVRERRVYRVVDGLEAPAETRARELTE